MDSWRGWWRLAVVVLLGGWLLGAGATAMAGARPTEDEPPAPRVLFDGKTLTGWKVADLASPGPVEVRDGVIVMGMGGSMTGITSTLTDLPTTNYELLYEARRTEGGDFFAAATVPVGDSHITFINGGWHGNVTGLSSINGADASENSTTTWLKYENDRWYKFRIRVTDEVIRCWVDDKEIIDLDHRDVLVGLRLETYANRPLGFATYKTTGELRQVELRGLTPQEVAETRPPEEP